VTIHLVTHSAQGDITRILTDDDASTFVSLARWRSRSRAPADREVQLAVRPGLGSVAIFGEDPAGGVQEPPPIYFGPERSPNLGVRAAFLSERDPRIRLRFSTVVTANLTVRLQLAPASRTRHCPTCRFTERDAAANLKTSESFRVKEKRQFPCAKASGLKFPFHPKRLRGLFDF
jgi:hypothetical protein